MQRSALVLTAFALCSTATQAQSSVTLYGSVDAGVTYVNNERGAHNVRVDSGNRSPDRWGLRGVEDLGDGLRAIFALENGFNLDDGTMKRAGVIFSRYAYVGLAGRAGTLSFGHLPDFMYEYLRPASSGSLGSTFFYHPGNLDNLANQFQIDNAVKYESPSFGGLQFGAINGFGETPDDFNRARSYSFGMRYQNSNTLLSGAYTKSYNRSLNIGGTLGIGSLLGQTLSSNAGTPAATFVNFNANEVRSFGFAGSYKLGMFMPHAMYSNVQVRSAVGAAAIWNAEVGTDIYLQPAETIGVSYTYSKLEGNHWNQFNLIGMHALSKRTTVYVAGSYQRAGGDARFAAIQSLGPSSGRSQLAARIGMHHLF